MPLILILHKQHNKLIIEQHNILMAEHDRYYDKTTILQQFSRSHLRVRGD